MSKTSSKVKNRYNEKVYDRVIIAIPKGTKEKWKKKAEQKAMSLTKYIQSAVNEYK